MNDGGMKLNCTALRDILNRVMITNALRLVPVSVKGFSFLKCLKLHMTSYTDKSEDGQDNKPSYPLVRKKVYDLIVRPVDSEFDKKIRKKRKLNFWGRRKVMEIYPEAVKGMLESFTKNSLNKNFSLK